MEAFHKERTSGVVSVMAEWREKGTIFSVDTHIKILATNFSINF